MDRFGVGCPLFDDRSRFEVGGRQGRVSMRGRAWPEGEMGSPHSNLNLSKKNRKSYGVESRADHSLFDLCHIFASFEHVPKCGMHSSGKQ